MESHCGSWGLCSWGDHGPICCGFPPTKIGYPGMYGAPVVERDGTESEISDENADGNDKSVDEEGDDGMFIAVWSGVVFAFS